MRIRVLGAGWYGAHVSAALLADGHDVEVHEVGPEVFSGASGGCPARLHKGFHYPRSSATRIACQAHAAEFMATYGHLTRPVPVNIYAIAAEESLVDFATYRKILANEVEFVTIDVPSEWGLQNVEGAVLTGERHVVVERAKAHFEELLADRIRFGVPVGEVNDPRWDVTIDCTFCANDGAGIDRYEPCLMVLLEGPADRSVTVMDGPFAGIYVFDEDRRLSSLTSAKLTPFSKSCRTYREARHLLNNLSQIEIAARGEEMLDQMAHWWPAVRDHYRLADYRLAIRAMPRSGSDARLVDVVPVGDRAIRVRAGKIDAVFDAARAVKAMLP